MKRFLPSILGAIGFLLLCAGNIYGLLLFLLACLIVRPRQAALFSFPSNCSGRLVEVNKTSGCSLSVATVRAWLPSDLEGADMKEIGYDKVYDNLREARLAGYQESTLTELVMSRVTNMKSLATRRNIKGSESMVMPFIQMRQKRNINVQYWKVTAGAATPGAGVGELPASAWDLTVDNQSGPFGTTLPTLSNFFLPGRTLFVDYADTTAHHLAYTILSAATVAGVTKVTVAPNYSAAGWGALIAADKLVYQIGGLAGGDAPAGTGCYLGANSVSDYESYKEKDTALNPNSLLTFWPQTARYIWDYDDQWLKLLMNPNMGTYFKTFHNLPVAEQRRQTQKWYEDQIMQTVFFGQRINELQAVATYDSLPIVRDPANDNCPLEFKTNAIGIQQQLIDCGRYIDRAGNPIDLLDFFERLYLIKRARQADSNDVSGIDVMTDRYTAGLLEQSIGALLAKYYNQTNSFFMRLGEVVDMNRKRVWGYREYDLPDAFGGYQLRVFTHEFFNDKISAFNGTSTTTGMAGTNNVHRMLWVIDWSDFYMGITGTNSRESRTNEADELYRYRIKINHKYVSMNSLTFVPVLEDPNRHLIYRNFSAACPTVTFTGCTVPNPQVS